MNRHIGILILIIAITTNIAAFTAPDNKTITVAAASSLNDIGPKIGAAFEASHPGYKVVFIYGASGTLATQILNGAPYQVFMSADRTQAKTLADKGMCINNSQIFALGSLILFSTSQRNFANGLSILNNPDITQFAIANPEIAPYGSAAVQALTKIGMWDTVKTKAVIAQNHAQALQYVLQVTGIGFISKSLIYAADMAKYRNGEGRFWLEVPHLHYSSLEYSFVVIKTAHMNSVAVEFGEFLLSAAVRTICADSGYTLPSN